MYEKVEKKYKHVCYIRALNLYESLSSSLALTNTFSKFIKGKIIGFGKFSTIYLEFLTTTDCKKKFTLAKVLLE